MQALAAIFRHRQSILGSDYAKLNYIFYFFLHEIIYKRPAKQLNIETKCGCVQSATSDPQFQTHAPRTSLRAIEILAERLLDLLDVLAIFIKLITRKIVN